jgi:tetratricopeptide (TPR) repeat protein
VFAQLSVFRGGFSLDAVEAVVDPPGSDGGPWTFDVIQGLLDQSLLRTVGPDRFDLLFVVRAYGEERLVADTRARAERRHGDHFSRLAADALDRIERHQGTAPRDQLATELHNLIAACERATARGDGEVGATTALGAWAVLEVRGGYAWGARLLERAGAQATRARARVLTCLGTAHDRMGQMQQALERHQEALQIARGLGDAPVAGRALTNIGAVHTKQGQMELARRAYHEALGVAREVGDRRHEAIALICAGNLHLEQDRMPQALEHYEEALGIVRQIEELESTLRFMGSAHPARQESERRLAQLKQLLLHIERASG